MKIVCDPLVSIIIPTSNRQHLLNVAINSVLTQTYTNFEIIIVDDCSDKIVKLSDFCDERIKIIRNDRKKGGAASRNVGVEFSKGEYVGFLDDDDWYFPEKIEILLNEIKKSKDIDAVFGRILRVSGVFSSDILPEGRITNIKNVRLLHTNSSLIRRSTFDKVRFHEKLDKFQDTQLHMELINNFCVHYYPVYVAYWRDHYVGERITDMSSTSNIRKSIVSYNELILHLSGKSLSKSDLNWLRRGYLRHLAKYETKDVFFSLNDAVYYYLVRFFYLMVRVFEQKKDA